MQSGDVAVGREGEVREVMIEVSSSSAGDVTGVMQSPYDQSVIHDRSAHAGERKVALGGAAEEVEPGESGRLSIEQEDIPPPPSPGPHRTASGGPRPVVESTVRAAASLPPLAPLLPGPPAGASDSTPSPTFPSDDHDHDQQQQQQQARRESELIQLLCKASETIKQERRQLSELRRESEALREQLASVTAQPRRASAERGGGGGGGGSSSASDSRHTIDQLRIANTGYARRIAALEAEIAQLRAREPSPRWSSANATPTARRVDGPSRGSTPANGAAAPRAAAVGQDVTNLDRRPLSPSVGRSSSSYVDLAFRHQPPTPAPSGCAKSPPQPSQSPAATTPSHRRGPGVAMRQGPRAASASPDPPSQTQRDYNAMMITRLRRALAPQPTREQLGEVVHAMVVEMGRDMAQRGHPIDLRRLAPCVYQCGTRKLHLSIDSGRLMVKAGGGHVELLEHLTRFSVR